MIGHTALPVRVWIGTSGPIELGFIEITTELGADGTVPLSAVADLLDAAATEARRRIDEGELTDGT